MDFLLHDWKNCLPQETRGRVSVAREKVETPGDLEFVRSPSEKLDFVRNEIQLFGDIPELLCGVPETTNQVFVQVPSFRYKRPTA
jgi:hypothetical protein